MPAPPDVVAFIVHVRGTHVEWMEFLERGGEIDTDVVGDIAHHEECIAGYDAVLAYLRT